MINMINMVKKMRIFKIKSKKKIKVSNIQTEIKNMKNKFLS